MSASVFKEFKEVRDLFYGNKAVISKLVFFGNLSFVSNIVAFIVPMKILFMVSGSDLSKKMPVFMNSITPEYLIIAMIFVTLIAYLVSFTCESKVNKDSDSFANSLVNKIEGLNGRERKFTKKRFIKSIDICINSAFIIIVMMFYALNLPVLFFTILIFSFLIIFIKSKNDNGDAEEDIEHDESEDEKSRLWLIDLGFFVSFGGILVSLFYFEANLIVAFICFILLRKSLASVRKTTKSFMFLTKKSAWVRSTDE